MEPIFGPVAKRPSGKRKAVLQLRRKKNATDKDENDCRRYSEHTSIKTQREPCSRHKDSEGHKREDESSNDCLGTEPLFGHRCCDYDRQKRQNTRRER